MKISIITATYNSDTTVRDTIESVLSQTYNAIEYIIVDGGSKDDTMNIVREYVPKFGGRMRYVSEFDKGIYDAMNKGIRLATGDVVGILNSDDFFTSNDVVEHVVSILSDSNIDGIFGDVHYVRGYNLNKCVRYYSSKNFRRWQMRFGFMPAHPSFYCRRDVYNRFGNFDISIPLSSDFECLLRFFCKYHIRVRYIPMDFVTMRTGGASSSGFRSYKQALSDKLLALRKNRIYSNITFLIVGYLIKCVNLIIYKFKNRIHWGYDSTKDNT